MQRDGATLGSRRDVRYVQIGAPLAGFEDIICLEEDPEMGACLTQKITFKFSPPPG